jgi:hypothetical protein
MNQRKLLKRLRKAEKRIEILNEWAKQTDETLRFITAALPAKVAEVRDDDGLKHRFLVPPDGAARETRE